MNLRIHVTYAGSWNIEFWSISLFYISESKEYELNMAGGYAITSSSNDEWYIN